MEKQIRILKVNQLHDVNDFEFERSYTDVIIKNDLITKQTIVNGLIEPVTLFSYIDNGKTYTIDLVCNEEGKLFDMPYRYVLFYDENTCDYIQGECYISKCDMSCGVDVSLSDNDIDELKKRLYYCNAQGVDPVDGMKKTFYLPCCMVND